MGQRPGTVAAASFTRLAFTSPLAEALAPDVLERFLRYVRIDTQSGARARAQSRARPASSTSAALLVDELHALGLADAALDDNGYVFATLPATARRAARSA